MFDFIKFKYLFFFISLAYLIPGMIALGMWGLKPAIDFTGGAVLEVVFTGGKEKAGFAGGSSELKAFLFAKDIPVESVQSSGKNQYILRTKPMDDSRKNEITKIMSDQYGPITELRFETLGPTLGQETLVRAALAVVLGLLLIFIYIAYQFHDYVFGAAAIIATVHDGLVVLGSLSLLGHFFNVEVDVLFVTALLTTLSFSVHDTVVVYDRIRESVKHFPQASLETLVNKASNETLVRSLNNSLTVVFMLTALFLLGGPTIKWFSLTLLIGTITGTYSSVCTAAPLLVVWRDFIRKQLWKKKSGS
ncbi:MAG: protein translocase subunit SecF [Patescibacteria group bacterium]